MVATLGVTGLELRCASLVSQVNKKYATKDERMATYLQIVFSLKSKFPHCDFKHVSRSENNHAESLANLASAVDYQFQ